MAEYVDLWPHEVIVVVPEELPGFHPDISVFQNPIANECALQPVSPEAREPIRRDVRLGPSPFPETTHCTSLLVVLYSLSIYQPKKKH